MNNAPYQGWAAELLSWGRRPLWLRRAIAPISVLLVLGLRLLLAPLLPAEASFLLFLAAVLVSAWVGGRAAGLCATLMAALLVDYLFLAPVGRVFVGDTATVIALALFIIEGGLISSFGGTLDAALRLAAQQAEISARHSAEIAARRQAEADLSERLRIETVLRASEARYRALVEHLPNIAVLMFDHDLRYLLVDGPALARHGYTKAEMEGRTVWEILVPERAAALAPVYQAALRGEALALSHERDGYTYSSRFVPVYDRDGQIIAGMAVVEDTTERSWAEAQLRASLQEKEVLLKEIHHRVKNNLQLITSLLRLQSDVHPDQQLRGLLRESQQRIRAIALIHERLYQSSNLARVDIASYVRSLTGYLARSYHGGKIQVVADVDELVMSIDQAVPCGLLIHELVSNAFKHAFPDQRPGLVTVSLHHVESVIELGIVDDGVGLRQEQVARSDRSLGMQLVDTFVEQLRGKLSLLPGSGTHVRIVFPHQG